MLMMIMIVTMTTLTMKAKGNLHFGLLILPFFELSFQLLCFFLDSLDCFLLFCNLTKPHSVSPATLEACYIQNKLPKILD